MRRRNAFWMKGNRWLLVLVCCFWLSGCFAGPHQLRRSVGDWDNQLYTDTPWMNGILHVVPAIPLAYVFAGIADFLILDAVAFWGGDAWGGTGTSFEHYEVTSGDHVMRSLLIDESGLAMHTDR